MSNAGHIFTITNIYLKKKVRHNYKDLNMHIAGKHYQRHARITFITYFEHVIICKAPVVTFQLFEFSGSSKGILQFQHTDFRNLRVQLHEFTSSTS
jgi:hypothetical protein